MSDDELFQLLCSSKDSVAQKKILAHAATIDANQARRAEQLLHSHLCLENKTETSLLDDPVVAYAVLNFDDESMIGSTIGRYQIEQLLGEGGMGVVYLVTQTGDVNCKLALKLVKLGMDSEKILARFQRERQTLACLDHPAITRVLDAGISEQGRPYFVMELAEGESITEFCDRKKLNLRERLALLIEVCDAIEHAHQRGIIHRDIKPSHIVVCEKSNKLQIKVIDFGIAKVVQPEESESSNFTRQGDLLGTFRYMSPEQAWGNTQDLDTRSDVYSLGVVLYELLSGDTPLAKDVANGGTLQVALHLRNDEPIAPSQRVAKSDEQQDTTCQNRSTTPRELKRYIENELDWITLRALEKDRDRRYQSVADFRRDLERFLQSLPVDAAPASVAYRLKKLVVRNRALCIVGATTAIAITLAIILSTIQTVRAVNAERDASSRLEQVLQMQSQLVVERDRAKISAKRARTLAQFFIVPSVSMEAAERFVKDYFDEIIAERPELSDVLQGNVVDFSGIASLILYRSNLLKLDRRLAVQVRMDWLSGLIRNADQNSSRYFEALLGDQSTISEENNENKASEVAASDLFPTKLRLNLLKYVNEQMLTSLGADSLFVANSFDELGLCQMDYGQLIESEQSFRDALAIREQDSDDQFAAIQTRLFLVECLVMQSKIPDAKKLLEETSAKLELMDKNLAIVDLLTNVLRQKRDLLSKASVAE